MKYVIAYMDLQEYFPNLQFAKKPNGDLVVVTSEKAAISYIGKTYDENIVFYGLIPDPTKVFEELKNEN